MPRLQYSVLCSKFQSLNLSCDLNEQEYNKIVDEVSARYAKLGKVGAAELKHLAEDMKNAWKHVSKELN